MVRSVLEETAADPDRVYVAGISAGGAMAQTLVAAWPDLFGAVAVHSAPAYRSARDVPTAFAVLQQGAPDSVDLAGRVLETMGPAARPVPTLVIHGADDPAVRVVNGDQVLRQWAAVAVRAGDGAVDEAAGASAGASGCPVAPGLDVTAGLIAGETPVRCVYTGAPVALEYWRVRGLGHAWSGGSAEGTFADPDAPDATERILAFFLAADAQP